MAKNELEKLKLSTKDRLNLFNDLSTMLTAGIPIIDAVESLEIDSKNNQKKIFAQIRKALANGIPMSRALEQMPKAFDAVSINLIRSAEASGTLETTLKDIVVATKKEIAFTDQLRNTMIYPLFVMVLFLGIVVLMLSFVMPRVSSVFSTMNVKIPLITRILMKASKFFTSHYLIIIAVFIALIVLAVIFVNTHRRFIVRSVLSLPMLKTLGTNIDLARFTRSFGLLLSAGVPIIEALKLSERVVQKKSITLIIKQMEVDIAAGKSISLSMRKSNSIIPTVMWRSIKTAETTGTLDQTLQNLSEHFDNEVAESLKILSSLIEPILIVVVGLMVGLLMISIIAPIYNMISQINTTPQ